MIVITTIDGVLRIGGEVKIPSATRGQWSPARIGKLIEMIQQTVEAGELADSGVAIMEETEKISGSKIR